MKFWEKFTRHSFVLALFLSAVAVWTWRIIYVQTNPEIQKKIRDMAITMHRDVISTKEARGTITDRNGTELARSYMVGSIIVDSVQLNEGNAQLFLSKPGNRSCSANGNRTKVKAECEERFTAFLLEELKDLLAYLEPGKSPEVLLKTLRTRQSFLAFPKEYVRNNNGKPLDSSKAVSPENIIDDKDRPTKKLTNARGKVIRDKNGQAKTEFVPLKEGQYLKSEVQYVGVPSKYWRIKKDVPLTELDQVFGGKNYKGFSQENYYMRSYPYPELMSSIVGYVKATVDGIEGQGEAGVEYNFNEALLSKDGKRAVIRTKDNKVLHYLEELEKPQKAENLVLSVDFRLQYVAVQALQEALNEYRAKGAMATIVDVHSGEILAMVSLPTVDINNQKERDKFRDKNYMDKYEPGSVIKPIVVAAALDAGVISPNTSFTVSHTYGIGKNVVTDVGNYGTLDVAGIIKKSSNIGMAKISERFPRKDFYKYMRAFGFGQPALNFRAEANAILHDPTKRDPNAPKRLFYNNFAYANMHYGYAIEATAVQLASAYATIGNGGIRIPLTILKRKTLPQGTRVVSQKVARQVQHMMQSVVSGEGGTGIKADTEEYTVEGKTGTSHKIVRGRRGYSDKNYLSLFVGLVPSNNPKLAIVIMIDSPDKSKGHFGGVVAAPVFSKVASQSMKILGIAPDKIKPIDEIDLNRPTASPEATIGPTKNSDGVKSKNATQ